MELQSVTQPAAPAAPRHVPDQRAVADAAATRSDPRPEIALPIPPDNGQRAAVSQSMMAPETGARAVSVQPVERVLKPYGVTILPQSRTDEAITQTTADAAADRSDDRA
ncbi:hypothetical protein [Octadecabacter sp. R77987]|uniref:hypothetical protein n=1 Tax=Octadecabacter sp. R77987 TaxID=3093874 RepID=UPI003671F4E3